MNKVSKYHYDIIIRKKNSSGTKLNYLDNQVGDILIHRKSKNKGVALDELKDQIGITHFLFYQRVIQDLDKMNVLDSIIDFYSSTYEKTNGLIGWSPRVIEQVKKLSQMKEEKSNG